MEKSNSLITRDSMLVEGKDFIIFGEDFARHPHALEHLLRPLFETNRFLWVETIGLRSPKLSIYDIKRIVEKLNRWFFKSHTKATSKTPKNIIILSPLMIPFNQYLSVRKFNQWMVTRAIQKTIIKNKIETPITISSVPNACDYIGHFAEILKIYFCVDEFALWPGLSKELVERLETKIIEKSDLIIATSETLAKLKTKNGLMTPIITHGVDFDHFNIGIKKTKNAAFKICYYGLFDERSDQDVLIAISNSIALCEIHIFGNIVCNIKKLKEHNNIIFHGPVHYENLPKSIVEMDLFILPYVKNTLTHYINPLKLKEYLSSGRPVIASDLPEVIKLKDFLFVAKTPEEFVGIIQNIQNEKIPFDTEKTLSYISEHETWKAKAVLLSSLIKENT